MKYLFIFIISEKFIEQNVVRLIAEQIEKSRDEATEHLLSILEALIGDQRVVVQCQDRAFNLRRILEDHLKRLELDTFSEEKKYCNNLLKVIGDCSRPEVRPSEADR